MASKKYTLLEYLVALENKLKEIKKYVDDNLGTDYSELENQVNTLESQFNIFKTSITNTVDNNNTNILSKFSTLEKQFNTFKTSITNTVNTNNTTLLSKVNSLESQFNSFKTSITSTVNSNKSELMTKINNLETDIDDRVTDVENRVTTLENSGGTGGVTTSKTLIHEHTVTEGTILNVTDISTSDGRITTDTDFNLLNYTGFVTPIKKEGVNYFKGTDLPKEMHICSNAKLTSIIDNTFILSNNGKYTTTGNFEKFGLLVDGLDNYTVNSVFQKNKNYEIEIYTTQPYYVTGLYLNKCVTGFNANLGLTIGGVQYSTYLNTLELTSCEGINSISHKIKLFNYENSFKLELSSICDGLNSNTIKFKNYKFEYLYNGAIMTNFSYSHYRNLIPKGANIKIYEIRW